MSHLYKLARQLILHIMSYIVNIMYKNYVLYKVKKNQPFLSMVNARGSKKLASLSFQTLKKEHIDE